ncbi:MAG: PAS domain-containing protein [Alphaproteobacteria bacterium]|nr:PAS domain-containing protein [Alphaproteobacteria bacterium]
MSSPRIRRAYTYWSEKQRGAALPARADIDPSDIPTVLPHMTLVERDADTGRMRYRLFGSALVDLIGRDPTGQYLDEVYPDFNGSPSKIYREQVFDMGKPSHRIGRPTLRFAKDFYSVERLYLPLAEDGRNVDMVIGVLVFSLDTLD